MPLPTKTEIIEESVKADNSLRKLWSNMFEKASNPQPIDLTPVEIANRLKCECGYQTFLINTTSHSSYSSTINLVECSNCHQAFVLDS